MLAYTRVNTVTDDRGFWTKGEGLRLFFACWVPNGVVYLAVCVWLCASLSGHGAFITPGIIVTV